MMKFRWMQLLPAAALILGGTAVEAKVELAPVFSDNAVLQRDMEVPVWGWADPGESVTVKFADQTLTTTAGNDGKWMVKLAPLAASKENRTLEASGPSNTVSAQNVLVGEVWIASGQSNMEMPLWCGAPNYRHRNANGTGKEVADRTNMPTFRFTRMPLQWSTTVSPREPVKWNLAVPGAELEAASATAFFFGRELATQLDVPVGIIGAYWGGTLIEPWTPPEGFDSVPELASIAKVVNAKLPGTSDYNVVSAKVVSDYTTWLETYKKAIANGEQPPVPPAFPAEQQPFNNHQQPTVLYNKMLATYVPYAVRGGIWYQGEANLGDRMLYKSKMQALLNGWRKVFNNPQMAFYFAQLAPFNYGGDGLLLPQIWEAQQAFAEANEHVGMAVITDSVHDIHDIHPADKEVVGRRLANMALKNEYGRSDIKAESPRLRDAKIEGNAFILDFDFVESWTNADGDIPFFEIAGMDGVFHPAKATIEGTKIRISSDSVSMPRSMRYMWKETYEGKLANEAGLVLGAFRIQNDPTFDEILAYYNANSKLVYEYDLKSGSGFGDLTQVRYTVDNSDAVKGKLTRITYLAKLDDNNGNSKFVCVSMNPFTQNVKQIGVPVKSSGAQFQTRVSGMNVLSNVDGVGTGFFNEGNIEFWPNNYGTPNRAGIPNANNQNFDFGDEIDVNVPVGYGSMQIHNFNARQTVFAYNNFSAGSSADLGIGNQGTGNPDWTFSKSAQSYSKATLYVFVDEVPRKSEAELMEQVTARVPEAGSMKLAYAYDLKTGSGFGDRTQVSYEFDNSAALSGRAKKVAYLMVLNQDIWVYAGMDAFDPSVTKLGVPVKASGAVFQKKITNLEVKSNTNLVKTGVFAEGNIEFWSSNYGESNAAGIPGASDSIFDFGDQIIGVDPGYGSMQIHNFGEKQTVFAYNNFSAGPNADIGIGSQPANNPDWTFSGALKNYKDAWLYVLVDME